MRFGHRISDYDFIRAMLLAGFRLTGTTMGSAVLEKGPIKLFVPQAEVLGEQLLDALLRDAHVLHAQFATLLNRLGSRDTIPRRREA